MFAQLPDGVAALLWALVVFSVLVVVRAVWFGLKDLKALAESAKNASRVLGEATAALEEDRRLMQERSASLQARTKDKDI